MTEKDFALNALEIIDQGEFVLVKGYSGDNLIIMRFFRPTISDYIDNERRPNKILSTIKEYWDKPFIKDNSFKSIFKSKIIQPEIQEKLKRDKAATINITPEDLSFHNFRGK